MSHVEQRLALEQPGDHAVDAPVTCALTRFRLRSPHHMLPTYIAYRRVRREALTTPGLLQTAFLVEDSRTWYSLSIWAGPDVIPIFGANAAEHVEAAGKIFGRLAFDPERGPELWSTKWRLASISNNLNWGDLDLREAIVKLGG